jgi:hypothetical protein
MITPNAIAGPNSPWTIVTGNNASAIAEIASFQWAGSRRLSWHVCSGRVEQSQSRTDDPFHGFDDRRQDQLSAMFTFFQSRAGIRIGNFIAEGQIDSEFVATNKS